MPARKYVVLLFDPSFAVPPPQIDVEFVWSLPNKIAEHN